MPGQLTGRKVLAITVSAFGVIIAVNMVLAVQAVRTFPGLEVRNSYVASQTFNADRNAQNALGWHLAFSYDGAALRLDLTDRSGKPAETAALSATVGRPTEAKDDIVLKLSRQGGAYVAPVILDRGRWVIFIDAVAANGVAYRKRLELSVRG